MLHVSPDANRELRTGVPSPSIKARFPGKGLLDAWHALVNVNLVAEKLGVVFATASRLVDLFERAGILEATTGGRRNRFYRHATSITLFADQSLTRGARSAASRALR